MAFPPLAEFPQLQSWFSGCWSSPRWRGLPEGVGFWARARDGIERETIELATRVVVRVRKGPGSELLELWEEAGQPEEWYGAMDDLLARLGR